MKHFILITMVALGTLCHSLAGSIEAHFTNYNCSVTFPDGWMIAKTPPPKMLTVAVSTNHSLTFALAAFPINPGGEKSALSQLNSSLKSLMSKDGRPVVEGEKNLGGIPFHMFSGKVGTNVSGAAYTTTAGVYMYMIQTSSKIDNAGSDTNIQNVLASFHLLIAPPKAK